MFLALNLFDRFLETGPEFENDKDVQIKFLCCLYLSIKYYLTLTIPPSYPDVVSDEYSTPEIMTKIEKFEEELFSTICGFYLYKVTIYEAYDGGMMTEEIAEKLFRFYTDRTLELHDVSPDVMCKMALEK